MLKKLLIVIICVVTVCAVFGLKDNLDYDGFVYASTIVEGEASDITRDIDAFRLIVGMTEAYYPDEDQSALGWTLNEEGSAYKYTIWFGAEGFQDDPETYARKILETNVDVTSPEYQRIWDLAKRFTHPPASDGLEIVNIVTYAWNGLSAVISSLAYVVGDFIGVAFSVIEAVFYLLGF